MTKIPEKILKEENEKLTKALKEVASLIADHSVRLVEAQRDEICGKCPSRDNCPESQAYAEVSYQIGQEVADRLMILVAEETRNRLSDEMLEEGRKWFMEKDPVTRVLELIEEQDEKIKESFKRREKESEARYV